MSRHRTILITAAVTAEIGPLVRRLRLQRDRTLLPGFLLYEGVHARPTGNGGDAEVPVAVLVTGVGRARALEAVSVLLERHTPQRVLITGFAGALDPGLQAGDVIVPAALLDCDTGQRFAAAAEGTAAAPGDGPTLCTIDRLVATPAAKAELRQCCGAAAVDMESAAIARQCAAWKIPWTCVRAISDAAGDELPPFVLKLTRPDGRANLPAAIGRCLLSPRQIGPLIRLGRNSKTAAANLARKITDLL